MSNRDFESLLSIAKESALSAGEFLSCDIQANRKINKEFAHDVKIEADIQSERMILDYLMKKSDFSILSEEKGFIQRRETDFLWIIDPVDGSLNYSQNIPLCCVSIGLWRGREPILGVIYDFNRKEMFYGIAGKAAWLNGSLIAVSKKSILQKSILMTGFPVNIDLSKESINMFIQQLQDYRKVRMIGSAALSLAYVAAGRADAYYEKQIMLWDIAAGVAIVLGAGGKTNIQETEIPNCFNVYIANGCLTGA